MVQIFVKLGDEPKDWTIVELQGFLESDEEELAGLRIGDLHFDEQGIASLLIGHHVLTGKLTSLDKPFGVMRKKKIVAMETDQTTDDLDCGTSYEIVAFVKQKIIFKNRPRPIIVKAQPVKI